MELIAAVRWYRAGSGTENAGAILAALAGQIATVARRIDRYHPAIGIDDVRQQLVCELLQAAGGVDLGPEIWVSKMLMERAARRVRRWARRQERQGGAAVPESLAREVQPMVDPLMATGIPIARAAGVSRQDELLLVRRHVLGESFGAIAMSTGLSETSLRSRASRAAARIRRYATDGRDGCTRLRCARRELRG